MAQLTLTATSQHDLLVATIHDCDRALVNETLDTNTGHVKTQLVMSKCEHGNTSNPNDHAVNKKRTSELLSLMTKIATGYRNQPKELTCK